MAKSHEYGRDAELRAADWLVENRRQAGKVVRIIAKNFRTRRGEIDLILEESDSRGRLETVFVEVRARRKGAQVDALASVDARKRRSIARVAEAFLASYVPSTGPGGRASASVRFDVLAWDGDRWNHLPNAWFL